uniref:ADF-H domain-containing protein n=1 Tax=Astyanax mexicanus TaxID=7994 RepID=A0A8B9GW76_ASTMX
IDEVVEHYTKIRVRYQGSEEKERFKIVIMRMSEDQKSIIVDHESSLKVKDVEKEDNVFKKILSTLPEKDCRYALYDCTYETKESLKEDLVFIMWYRATSHKASYRSSNRASYRASHRASHRASYRTSYRTSYRASYRTSHRASY